MIKFLASIGILAIGLVYVTLGIFYPQIIITSTGTLGVLTAWIFLWDKK